MNNIESVLNSLIKIDLKKVNKIGIPLIDDKNNIYISNNNYNNLVISNDDNINIKSIYLPLIDLSYKSGENIIINYKDNFLYENRKDILINNGYKVININLINKMDKYNILSIPFDMYKTNKENSLKLINNIADNIFPIEVNNDPFWTNCSRSLFVGTCMYLFDIKNTYPSINDVLEVASKISNREIQVYGVAAKLVDIIVNAPKDTKLSILSTFVQYLRYYNIVTDDESSFNISDILNNKYAIFFITKDSIYNDRLYNILINQINMINNKFYIIDSNINSNYINHTCVIDKIDENNISLYGNIIYIYSNNYETEEIFSKLCGKDKKGEYLVSTMYLKTLNVDEVIVLTNRLTPYKVKLINYNIN